MPSFIKILDNPENPIFNLLEDEIYSLKEANELIILGKYSYSLFAIWSAVIINIQRRIESFGIEIFLNIIEKEDNFNNNGNTLKNRWKSVNEFNLIKYAKKINIFNYITYNFIAALYWMKSDTNEENRRNIDKEEVFSIVNLIEKNLFLSEFKIDQRSKNRFPSESSNLKRRRKDKEELITAYRNTHQELLLKSGVKMFNENSKERKDNKKLLDTYI